MTDDERLQAYKRDPDNEGLRREIVERYKHQVYRALRYRNCSHHDAEESVGIAFEEFFRTDQKTLETTTLLDFLIRKAWWRYLNLARKRKKEQEKLSVWQRDQVDSVNPEERDGFDFLAAALVEDALSALKPLEQEYIRLKFWKKLSDTEISKELGVTTNRIQYLVAGKNKNSPFKKLRFELQRRGWSLPVVTLLAIAQDGLASESLSAFARWRAARQLIAAERMMLGGGAPVAATGMHMGAMAWAGFSSFSLLILSGLFAAIGIPDGCNGMSITPTKDLSSVQVQEEGDSEGDVNDEQTEQTGSAVANASIDQTASGFEDGVSELTSNTTVASISTTPQEVRDDEDTQQPPEPETGFSVVILEPRPNSIVAVGSNIKFSAIAIGPMVSSPDFNWDFEEAQDPGMIQRYKFETTGTKKIEVRATDFDTAKTATSSITIQVIEGIEPLNEFEVTIQQPLEYAFVPVGTVISFNAEATNGESPITYAWHIDKSVELSGPTVSHTFATVGMRHIGVEATDRYLNVASDSQIVYVVAANDPRYVPLE